MQEFQELHVFQNMVVYGKQKTLNFNEVKSF